MATESHPSPPVHATTPWPERGHSCPPGYRRGTGGQEYPMPLGIDFLSGRAPAPFLHVIAGPWRSSPSPRPSPSGRGRIVLSRSASRWASACSRAGLWSLPLPGGEGRGEGERGGRTAAADPSTPDALPTVPQILVQLGKHVRAPVRAAEGNTPTYEYTIPS